MMLTMVQFNADRDQERQVFIHNVTKEDFDEWAPKMTTIRVNENNGRPYRTGILYVGGLELTIFER